MKKIILTIYTFSTLFVACAAHADTMASNDPFANQSFYIDDNYVLSTQTHTPIPLNGDDHSLQCTFPSGAKISSDFCKLSSPTQLTCNADTIKTTVTYDAVAHSATIDDGNDPVTTYYEKGHQPNGSPLSGIWEPKNPNTYCHFIKLTVPYTAENSTAFPAVHVDEYGGGGGTEEFYLVKGFDTFLNEPTLLFSDSPSADAFSSKYTLYDTNGNVITSTDTESLKNLAALKERDNPDCLMIKK